MNKLTAEKCREQFEAHIRNLDGDYNLIRVGEVYIDVETQIEWRTWQAAWKGALEIALPIPEQQERGDVPERQDSLKHVGYLFVNSGGGVVYSPSGFGMRGFTCAGKIYGDVSFQPEQPTNQNGEQ